MNASLLSAIQTEPSSLILLGATLFALSSFARRRAVVASPANPASVIGADAAVAPASAHVEPHSGLIVAA